MSTKAKILAYLKSHGQVSGMQLEMQAYEWRTKPSTISRRARELTEEGRIKRVMKGKAVQYSMELNGDYPLTTRS